MRRTSMRNGTNAVPWRRVRTLTFALIVTLLFALLAVSVTAEEERALYKDLGLTKDASTNDVKRAFRRLTREFHPDTKESKEEKEVAKVTMARVLRAYEVLSSDEKRIEYDSAGIIPGEPIDPKEHSAKDIFEYYHQKVPIFSKSETIDSLATVDRIKSFHGRRLFLVQVYDDECAKCRVYVNVWETLYQSGLVSAGIIKMYRIDAKSVDGPLFMKKLGLSYSGSEPTVAAFIDGEKWSLFGIREALKRQKERTAFEHLLDFTMNFFYETHTEVKSLKATLMDSVVTFLKKPRTEILSTSAAAAGESGQAAVHVLFPKLNAESVPLAVHMRYGKDVVVRSVSREILSDFVEEYCEMAVEVLDRRGELVPLPEFVVVSTEVLGLRRKRNGDEGSEEEEEEEDRKPAKCNGIQIGASASLTYEKAAQFVKSLLPMHHAGLPTETAEKLPYLDSMQFAETCEKNCLMWVRESCAVPQSSAKTRDTNSEIDDDDHDDDELTRKELRATATVLAQDYLSFKSGYLCLNEQPDVKAHLEQVLPGHVGKKSHRGPLLLALTDSDDRVLYAITALHDKAPLELTSRDVDAALSGVLDIKSDLKSGRNLDAHYKGVTRLKADIPFTTLLPADAFPLSQSQRVMLIANTVVSFALPYVTNTAPFVLMWFVHTKVLGRKNTGPDPSSSSDSHGAENNANGTAPRPPGAGLPKGFPTGKKRVPRPKSPEPPRPKNMVEDYKAQDLQDAREGKGFLVLLLDDRPLNSEALKLPVIMSDPRFTVRTLGSPDVAWKEWIREKVKAAAGDGGEGGAALPEAEKDMLLFAIRKGRMQGAVKPPTADIESFLRDLLDGAAGTHTVLPDFS